MLLNSQWIKQEITKKIKKYLETNENGNTIRQNLWDAAKAVERGWYIALHAHIQNIERPQVINLTLHVKGLEKEEQTKPKVRRRKRIQNAGINEIENRKTIENLELVL